MPESDSNASPSWQRVDAALDELLATPPEGRPALIERLAAGDTVMARELSSLAARLDEDHGLLDQPALRLLSGDPPSLNEECLGLVTGTRLGPWRVLELIGRGGMGEVYRAERADGQFDMQVAIKLIRVDTPYQDARFRSERQILARLDHPGISRLLDGDVTADGRPYMVMEFVQGQQIVSWCRETGAGLEQRLSLFAEVCDAVAYAHRNLVVHRDLKPANVLVTPEGRPKLLDFGISRLLDTPTGDATRELALTPGYAAPEQFTGAPVTTAADVYTLGLLLHELLCGEPAHPVQRQPLAAAMQQLLPQPAESPSRAAALQASPPVPAKRLAGDLDAIVAKALREAPEQRYASANELRMDLDRFRRQEPVRARPDRLAYRARKFVGRFRVELACTMLAVAALVSVTGYAVMQAQKAQLAARQATAVKEFLLKMLTGEDPGLADGRPPSEATVLQLLDKTSHRMVHELDDQPEVKIELLQTLGSAYETMDRPAQSVALLKQALAMSERADRVPHPREAHLLIMLADAETFAGHFDAAQPWLDRATEVFSALGDRTSSDYARSLTMVSMLLRRAGSAQLPAARDKLLQAVALYRERHSGDEGRTGALMALAQVYRGLDDVPDALRVADEAVAVAAGHGVSPVDVANSHSLRAAIRDVAGDAKGALEDYNEAATGYAAGLGAEHFLTLSNDSLRGQALLRLGREKEGLEALQRSADALGRTRMGSNSHAAAVMRLGVALVGLGLVEQAEPVLQLARALWQQRKDPLQGSPATLALAKALHQRGEEAEARQLLDEVFDVRRKQEHHTVAPLSEVQLTYAQFAFDGARLDEAQREALAALQSAADPGLSDQVRRLRARDLLARVALARGESEAALHLSAELLAAAQAPALAGYNGLRSTVFETRGRVLCASGLADDGRGWLQRALELREPLVDPVDVIIAGTRLALSACLAPDNAAAAERQIHLAHQAYAAHAQVAPYLSAQLPSHR